MCHRGQNLNLSLQIYILLRKTMPREL
jgi:hypothetical protein